MEKHFNLDDKGWLEHDADCTVTGGIATMDSSAPADTEIIRESVQRKYDPLKAYLKSMSLIPLLTKEEEVAAARRIEACKFKIFSLIFTIPFVVKKLAALGRLVKEGEAHLSEFVQDIEDMSEEEIETKKERFLRITESIHAIIRKMEKQKKAGAAKLLMNSKHGRVKKIQELNLKYSVVEAFSE